MSDVSLMSIHHHLPMTVPQQDSLPYNDHHAAGKHIYTHSEAGTFPHYFHILHYISAKYENNVRNSTLYIYPSKGRAILPGEAAYNTSLPHPNLLAFYSPDTSCGRRARTHIGRTHRNQTMIILSDEVLQSLLFICWEYVGTVR